MDTPEPTTTPTDKDRMEARARVNKARLELKRAEDALRVISPSDFDRNLTQRLMQLQHDERQCQAERHNIQQDMFYQWHQNQRMHTKPPQSNICTCTTCTRVAADLIHTLYTPWTNDK